MTARRLRWVQPLGLAMSLLWVWVGCATPKIDWNSRIANYTFDQAVTELGPPDKSAKLTDGTTVAEWLTGRGYTRGWVYSHHAFGLYPPYYIGPGIDYYDVAPGPNYYLRLTFGPDGK